jgi:CRISPR-associated protein Csb1
MSKSESFDAWLSETGPAALVMRQILQSIEGAEAAIFPPTYPSPTQKKDDPPTYNIDGEGERSVCLIDSVGSQANRIEPLFEREPLSTLVPQISINMKGQTKTLLKDMGHRIADAALKGTEMRDAIEAALLAYRAGDATKLAKLAPTTLIFGAWDSRGTYEKIARLINSTIRATNVQKLSRSAQYSPPIDYRNEQLLPDDLDADPADVGLAAVPSVGVLGGVIVRGEITRNLSLNLVGLRKLRAGSLEETQKLQKYILGLSLVALSAPIDFDLRQGCHLVIDPNGKHVSELVYNDGERKDQRVDPESALAYATSAAKAFGVGESQHLTFDAKQLGARLKKSATEKAEKKSKPKK